jgi:uncharacterized protein YdaU (DUF1376 family)
LQHSAQSEEKYGYPGHNHPGSLWLHHVSEHTHVDPLSILFAANACVAAIKQGCKLYKDAKTSFMEIKKTVNEVTSDVKAVQRILGKVLRNRPRASKSPACGEKEREAFVAVDETQVMADIVAQLSEFFKLQEQLAEHIRQEEEKSKTVYDPDANLMEAALKRVMAQDQMTALEIEIREAMVYQAPPEMGALYSKVFQMRDVIKAEQDKARKKLDGESWLRKEKERLLQERQTYLVLTFLFLLYLWVLLAVLSRIGNN